MGTDRNTTIRVDREKIISCKSTGTGLCILGDLCDLRCIISIFSHNLSICSLLYWCMYQDPVIKKLLNVYHTVLTEHLDDQLISQCSFLGSSTHNMSTAQLAHHKFWIFLWQYCRLANQIIMSSCRRTDTEGRGKT